MANSIVIPILVISILLLCLSTHLLFMYFRNASKKTEFDKISKKIEDLKIKDLEIKMTEVKDVLGFGVTKDEYDNLQEDITRITEDSYRKIITISENIKIWFKKWYLPINQDVQRTLQDLDQTQFKYTVLFLNIRFRIHDLLINQEIQDTVIYKVRELYSEVSINNKNLIHNEISNSKIFGNKTQKIEKKISKLEDSSYKNIKFEDSISMVKDIVNDIQEADIDLKFLIDSLNFLKLEVPKLFSEFKDTYKTNPKIFYFLNLSFRKSLDEVKDLEKKVFQSIIELKKNLSKEQMAKINHNLNNLVQTAKLNYESHNFIKQYENRIIRLINEFDTKKEYLIDEIRRYEVNDKAQRIKYITDKSQVVQNLLVAYKRQKQETYRKNTPYELAISLSKVVEEYDEYIKFIRNNVQDINEIIKQTDKINQEVAKMNVILLDIETKMKFIPLNIQYREQQTLEKLQKATSHIIEIFRKNTGKINEKEKKIVEKLHIKIKDLNRKISTEAFVYNYIQWVIMELNRFINTDKNFVKLLIKVEDAYHKANAHEALRIAKEITDIYKIYE